MPSKNGRGRNKRSSRKESFRRGMKESEYRIHLKLVRSGQTSWQELETLGLIPKQQEHTPRGVAILAEVERRKAKRSR